MYIAVGGAGLDVVDVGGCDSATKSDARVTRVPPLYCKEPRAALQSDTGREKNTDSRPRLVVDGVDSEFSEPMGDFFSVLRHSRHV